MSEVVVAPLEELDRVSLTRAIACDPPRSLPAGSTGTIVAVLEHGVGYVVEFTKPFEALVDVDLGDIEGVPGESRHDLLAGRVARRAS